MSEREPADIFFSYSPKDKLWVSEFASALMDDQIKVLFNVSKLVPGENWSEANSEVLRHSHTLVVILSANSLESPSVFFELGAAYIGEKRIIPVVAEDIGSERLPFMLKRLELIKEPSPIEAGKRVAKMIKNDWRLRVH